MSELEGRLQAALGGSYHLERELGGGGMSRVFLAEETALGRRVVLKVLPPEWAHAFSDERFRREIQLAAQLQHPHIVPLHHAGVADGLRYYTMPYVEGESLRARLNQVGGLPMPEASRILREVADALAYAHKRGVVHRDIKPENILLSGGHAVVTDFGVAKAVATARTAEGGASLTTEGVSIGTPAYMAPEQIAADPAVDQRADLYAFGVMGYELLTGRTPFQGRTPQAVLAAHLSERPADLAVTMPACPPALATLLMQCLEKNPSDRPESAQQILRTLEEMPAVSGSTKTPKQPASILRNAVSVAVALALLAALGSRFLKSRAPTPVAPVAVRSLAVLPLESIGGAADDYFADGLTEELTGALGRVGGLRVAARTSAAAFKGKSVAAREVGDKLKVDAFVAGSVRRSGRDLRVTAQLINVADGLTLWSDNYQRTLVSAEDLFKIEDDIAQAVVHAVAPSLAGGRPARSTVSTTSLEAHDLYLQGQFFSNKKTEADIHRGLELFHQALALDSSYARAWARIADAWSWLADDWVAPKEAYPKAREASLTALRLDSTSPHGHGSLGVINMAYDWDLAAAEREINREMALTDDSSAAYDLADLMLVQGHPDSALVLLRIIRRLDPLNPDNPALESLADIIAGRGDEAVAVAREAVALDPYNPYLISRLGEALLAAGKPTEALSAVENRPEMGARLAVVRACAFAALGRPADARAVLKSLRQAAKARYIRAESFAKIFASLGEPDSAFAWLETAYAQRSAGLVLYLRGDPAYRPLHADPRFAALLRRVGLPPLR